MKNIVQYCTNLKNLEPMFILESCKDQMITSKRIELQISNTTHLKELFKAWVFQLFDWDIENKIPSDFG